MSASLPDEPNDHENDGNQEHEPNPEETPEELEGPPEEDFDEKYNKHMEFPIALVAAVMIHVMGGAIIIFLFLVVMGSGPDKSGVPVKLVNLQGFDESGEGSAGSGGVDDPTFKSEGDPLDAPDKSLLDASKLSEVKEKLKEYMDPSMGITAIAPENAQKLDALSDSIKKKLLGAKRGAGSEKGSGYDGSQGKGPGGTGADSTLGRSMRWVLRFTVAGGRDYLEQLKTMSAILLIPEPGTDKCTFIEDIKNPRNQRIASDDDMRMLGDRIKFGETRPSEVKAIAQALGLEFTPKSVWAFFPKELEEELTRKEKSFRGRQPDDIEETVFTVRVRGGNVDIRVDSQTPKR